MTTLTASEQLLLEMANRARLDPNAEAARLGITLNQFIQSSSPGSPISAASKQPLAGSNVLQGVAERHASVVFNNPNFDNPAVTNFDAHNGAGDGSVSSRIAAAGYSQNALPFFRNENFAYGKTSEAITGTNLQAMVEARHDGLFIDDPRFMHGEPGGHRLAMLDPNMKEMGAGTLTGVLHGSNALLAFENFGVTGTRSFLTGAVYDDTVKVDKFYTIGEAVSGVTVKVTNLSGGSVGSDTTGSGGGWSVSEPGGTHKVTFSGGGLDHAVSATVQAGSLNAKVDLVNETRIESSASLTLGDGARDLRLLGMSDIDGIGNTSGNRLVGNTGDNELTGGSGRDILTGGAGDDLFIFRKIYESKNLISNSDFITDFRHVTQHDKIDLHLIDAEAGVSGNQAFHFIGKQEYSGEKGELRYSFSNGDTRIRGDIDGDGLTEFSITLDGHHTMRASDFLL